MKQKKKKSLKQKLIGFAPYLAGIILGVVLAIVMEQSGQNHSTKEGSTNPLLGIVAMALSIPFHLVTHEAGHLIFGLLSGYRFVSFRIGSLTLVRTKRQWKLKRFHIPGTGGQCLMAPPALDEQGDFPAKLYNLGGILVNLAFSVLFTVLAILVDNSDAKTILTAFAGMGYVMFLSNGIPLKVGGISNDGGNVLSMDKNPEGKRCLYLQLEVNARLSEGERMRDLPYELVKVEENAELKNTLIASGKLFEYYWYADQLQFEQGAHVLSEFEPVWNQIIPLVRNMIAVERIYLEIIHKNRQEIIEELLTNEVRTYLKNAKYDVHANRVKYGLALRKDSTSKETKKAKEHLLKIVRTNPVEGEALMSLELATYMEQQLAKENS